MLDVLRRNHVHATFFVVGTQVVAHPDLVRRIVADGHQIGIRRARRRPARASLDRTPSSRSNTRTRHGSCTELQYL
ncbi:polysaccharide deacetylase family protein [Streptomyces sp. Agncl-13]|uniref:polysaccharide deacetylase family protein n=1 Tax=Streptomyces sp. Agncl-13 TaxID=3400628 RepID=UPI003A87DB5A